MTAGKLADSPSGRLLRCPVAAPFGSPDIGSSNHIAYLLAVKVE
jgi:hypothetical protein